MIDQQPSEYGNKYNTTAFAEYNSLPNNFIVRLDFFLFRSYVGFVYVIIH